MKQQVLHTGWRVVCGISREGYQNCQWGFSYIITKKYLHSSSADDGFLMIAYKHRRIINIVGIDLFRDYLKAITNLFSTIYLNILTRISLLWRNCSLIRIFRSIFKEALKRLYLTPKLFFYGGFLDRLVSGGLLRETTVLITNIKK